MKLLCKIMIVIVLLLASVPKAHGDTCDVSRRPTVFDLKNSREYFTVAGYDQLGYEVTDLEGHSCSEELSRTKQFYCMCQQTIQELRRRLGQVPSPVTSGQKEKPSIGAVSSPRY